MNPLKLHLPAPFSGTTVQHIPTPGEIKAWLPTLPIHDDSRLAQILGLLERYNRLHVPTSNRLATMQLLQAPILESIQPLQAKYRDQALPLGAKPRQQAAEARHALEELAFGFKLIVNDVVSDRAENSITTEHLLYALRESIEMLGLLLVECYSLYNPPPQGLWGELHRLYRTAERTGLHRMALTSPEGKPLTTVQHSYLRLVLLALTQPQRLLSGQAAQIYGLLEKWTVHCRVVEKQNTEAQAGDMVVDLAGNQPPQLATGYRRFRPVDGRFIDISRLQEKLTELGQSLETQAHSETAPQPLKERLRRDLTARLCQVWQGRGDRDQERQADGQSMVLVSIGLNPAHHYLSDASLFDPDYDEEEIHLPTANSEEGLSLRRERHTSSGGARVTRFDSGSDVWSTLHGAEVQDKLQRDATIAGYNAEPWLCLDRSSGGVALRRQPGAQASLRVGTLLCFCDDEEDAPWRPGIVRWLKNNGTEALEIGVMAPAENASAIAVRALAGPGAGGEYFRSLLLSTPTASGTSLRLITPANLFDMGTQLVLNLKTELKYARLSRLIETSSAYSLFAFDTIEVPAEERQRIKALQFAAGQKPRP